MRRIYLRHDYAVEMKDAWQRLGAHLSALAAGAAPKTAS